MHQVVAVPALKAFVKRLWDEAEATLDPPPGLDIPAYRADLMARFSNPSLQHRTRQIAMDGSQKLPQRLLASITARLDAGQPIDALALGVAGWIKWQDGVTETGETFSVDDPMAGRIAETLSRATTAEARVCAVSSLSQIVSPSLAADPRFTAVVTRALAGISTFGVASWLTRLSLTGVPSATGG